MAKFSIDINDNKLRAELAALSGRATAVRPMLKLIGEALVESTKRRFADSVGPDGRKWAENSETTKELYANKFKASRTKKGRRSAAGKKRIANKKPLIGETRSLSTTITYQVRAGTLSVGSPMEYASTHQFGARRGQFGRSRRGGPIPWGNVPARPFLGISAADRDEILALVREILEGGI